MASISGVQVPNNERLEIGLTRIHGIGRTTAKKLVASTPISPDARVGTLSDQELVQVRAAIDKSGILVEGELKRTVHLNTRRLVDIKSYKGLRHRARLPVRGQRTKTNARQKRGRAQTIAGKKKVPQR